MEVNFFKVESMSASRTVEKTLINSQEEKISSNDIIIHLIDGLFSAAWPLVTLIVIIIFRKKIALAIEGLGRCIEEILKRMTKFNFKSGDFEFLKATENETLLKQMDEVEEEASNNTGRKEDIQKMVNISDKDNLQLEAKKLALRRIQKQADVLCEFSKFKKINIEIERKIQLKTDSIIVDGIYIADNSLYLVEFKTIASQLPNVLLQMKEQIKKVASDFGEFKKRYLPSAYEGLAEVRGAIIICGKVEMDNKIYLLSALHRIDIYSYDEEKRQFELCKYTTKKE